MVNVFWGLEILDVRLYMLIVYRCCNLVVISMICFVDIIMYYLQNVLREWGFQSASFLYILHLGVYAHLL